MLSNASNCPGPKFPPGMANGAFILHTQETFIETVEVEVIEDKREEVQVMFNGYWGAPTTTATMGATKTMEPPKTYTSTATIVLTGNKTTGSTTSGTKGPEKTPAGTASDPGKANLTVATLPNHEPQKLRKYPVEKIRDVYRFDVQCLCEHLNRMLVKNSLVTDYLPLKEENLFDNLKDGVLLNGLANTLQPGTVNEKALVLYSGPGKRQPFHSNHNLNLALSSLRGLGVCTESQDICVDADLIYHRGPLHLMGILLQIVRLYTVNRINVKDQPDLIYVVSNWDDAEELANIKSLSSSDLIKRWANYQLRRSGTDLALKDLRTGLADVTVHAHLLNAVAPPDKKKSLKSVEQIVAETDKKRRASMLIENAKALGLGGIIEAEHLVGQDDNQKLDPATEHRVDIIRSAFVAHTIQKYPNIEPPKEKPSQKVTESFKYSWKRGASEETLQMWLNSFGLTSPVSYLDTDLRSGVVLCQVLESMYPGSVNWSKVVVDDLPMPKRKFTWLSNCVEVLRVTTSLNLRVNCASHDIATGDKKNTLALVFVMMLRYFQLERSRIIEDAKPKAAKDPKPKAEFSDQNLVQWFNKTIREYGSNFQLKSIEDATLRSTSAMGFLAERVLNDKCRCQPCNYCQRMRSNNATPEFWIFETASPVPANEADKYSQNLITMLRQNNITVFTSYFGPDTDASAYRGVLLQLNAISTGNK